jgi:hypothetical protein
MRLPRVRFTVRRMMVAVAILAILIALPILVVREISRALYDFYGPGGTLERQAKSVPKL